MPPQKHTRTLRAVFERPDRSDIRWNDIEALLNAHDAVLTEGAGSRVRVSLNGVRLVLHRPHPQPTLKKGAVTSLRRFLTEAGVTP